MHVYPGVYDVIYAEVYSGSSTVYEYSTENADLTVSGGNTYNFYLEE